MTDYPLIKAMGLQVEELYADVGISGHRFVRADDLERALAAAPKVEGNPAKVHNWSTAITIVGVPASHYARLVCIEPIKRETAEDLLRYIVRKFNVYRGAPMTSDQIKAREMMDEIIKRADRFLSGG